MFPKSERTQNLVNYAREEIERFRAGESGHFPRISEITARFGYRSASYVSRILNQAGISKEGRLLPHERDCSIPTPSKELAWFIGVLVGAGNFNKTMNSFHVVRADSTDQSFLNSFKIIGEKLFNINSIERKKITVIKGKTYHKTAIVFYNSKATRFLGHLGRSQGSQTIMEQHRWILDQPKYIWSLLEGFFEANGGVYTAEGRTRHYRINLRTASLTDSLFLSELLTHVGIECPKLIKLDRASEGVAGVAIHNLDDLRVFSQNVNSRNFEKERRLDQLRQKYSQRGKIRITDKQIIDEWMNVIGLLGYYPTIPGIIKLRRENKTKYLHNLYAKRFGGGSFVRARENLERIIREQENENIPQQINPNREEFQIFP